MATMRWQYRLRGALEEPINSRSKGSTTLGLPPEIPTLPSLLKDAGANDLTDAIRRVASGETLLNAELAASILDEFRKVGELPTHPEHKLSELTEREEDILRLLAQGASNHEIATSLGVSEKTVRNRLSEIFSKLRLNNRTQAALYALREGIATLQDSET